MTSTTMNSFSFTANDAVLPTVKLMLTHKFSNGHRLVMQSRGDKYEVYYAFKTGPWRLCSGMQSFGATQRDLATRAFLTRVKSVAPIIAAPRVFEPVRQHALSDMIGMKEVVDTVGLVADHFPDDTKMIKPSNSLISRCGKFVKQVVSFVKKLFS